MKIQRLTIRDKAGSVIVRGIRVLHGGFRQNFDPELIRAAAREGWARIRDDEVQLKGEADLVYRYKILRRPGTYCCHCNAAIERSMMLHHVLHSHVGPSPDRENPSGYKVVSAYECVRV